MMSQNSKPLITIVGALSKQGRSVAHTLLKSGSSRVRALTRRVDAREAQSLARQGAELITVSLELGHKKDLVDAFRDSHGGFLMTPIIPPPATHETDLGKQQADAAVEAGVQHIIFSSLENVEKITGGKKWVPHFTDKAKDSTTSGRVTGCEQPGCCFNLRISSASRTIRMVFHASCSSVVDRTMWGVLSAQRA
jgi:saccharopine dehydrogenase-like NADP-dependent oxidoreductase